MYIIKALHKVNLILCMETRDRTRKEQKLRDKMESDRNFNTQKRNKSIL